ncbi:MAG: MtnX-like HAD-IB family phosphatase [Clostridia bacterium]|nr:MtnX-like HAD-IB family phosphatase [Clostridia bacterium]
MKRFAFVSDFDGTLTSKDFYHIVIEKYLGDKGRELYFNWKKTRKINVEFLNKIFGSTDLSERDLLEEILKIPIDDNAAGFMRKVKDAGGDFYIVSAGTSYYINILLNHLQIKDAHVISMNGVYKNGGIEIVPDPSSDHYSEVFGLDKRKVVEGLRKDYGYIFFAGDSEPDLGAAKAADTVYARGELSELLAREGIPFIPFTDFYQIEKDLVEKRWFYEGSDT